MQYRFDHSHCATLIQQMGWTVYSLQCSLISLYLLQRTFLRHVFIHMYISKHSTYNQAKFMPINYFTLLTINDKNLSPTTYTYLLVCYVEHTAICMCLIGCDYHLVYNFTNHYIFHEKHLLTLHEKYVDKKRTTNHKLPLCWNATILIYSVYMQQEDRRNTKIKGGNCKQLFSFTGIHNTRSFGLQHLPNKTNVPI